MGLVFGAAARGWGWFNIPALEKGWEGLNCGRGLLSGLFPQIAKLIQKLANTSSVREDYMMPLEPFVKLHNEALKVSF